MNAACVIALQYDNVIYMNVRYEQRPQRALFPLLLQLYHREIPDSNGNVCRALLKPFQYPHEGMANELASSAE